MLYLGIEAESVPQQAVREARLRVDVCACCQRVSERAIVCERERVRERRRDKERERESVCMCVCVHDEHLQGCCAQLTLDFDLVGGPKKKFKPKGEPGGLAGSKAADAAGADERNEDKKRDSLGKGIAVRVCVVCPGVLVSVSVPLCVSVCSVFTDLAC